MEDMLLREIEKTGKVLEAILLKLGVTTREKGEEAYDTARTGLREGLGMDFDAVLGSDDIAGTLTAGYGFGDDNLERFARILFCSPPGHRTTTPAAEPPRPPQPSTNTSKAAAPAASTTGITSSRSSKSISDTAHQSMFLIAYLVIWATKSCSSSFSGS